jgi:hypothetical protein
MTGTRSRITRLAVAAVLVVPAVVASVTPSSAAPSKQEVEAAQAQLARLQESFSSLNEQWNEARYQLSQAQDHLAEAKAMRDAAEQQAADARAQLSERAVRAYTDMGSQYEALLSASSMTEFSDRLEFLGAITQTDADLAAEADTATQRAAWAAQEYNNAVADAQAKADAMAAQRAQAQANLDEQRQIASQLQADYSQWIEAQQRALDAAQQQATTVTTPPPPTDSGGGGGYVPDPNASGAQIAIEAARSVLTSWAWAQAGVYLPHSASSQYSSLPRVPLSAVQPGDIIWYSNFGPHVALYIGGGQIIHATHPGAGGGPHYDSMYGYDTPYAAMRPGS